MFFCIEESSFFISGCHNLGVIYIEGKDVKQDYQQAKTYWEKACNLNHGAGCSNLGVLYYSGDGVRQAHGRTFWDKINGVKQDFQTAKEYYGKACDLGYQGGCDKYRELNEKGY